jgi:hypothetical protein
VKRWFVAVAAVAALLGGVLAPGAAQADPPGSEGYAFVDKTGFGSFDYVDINGVPVLICPKCYWWLDITHGKVLPQDLEARFKAAVLAGVQNLGRAHTARDPRQAQRYADAALANFSTAAGILGEDAPALGQVGYFDAERGVTVPRAEEWLAAAGQDLVDGLGLLQQVAGDPSPDPWIVGAATAQFEEAYQELSGKKAIGA